MTRILLLLLAVAPLAAVPLPPPLETSHIVGRGLPAGRAPVELKDELYALGWSRSNALALLERRWMGASYQVRYVVQDLVQDLVLEEQTWPDWGDDQERWWQDRQDTMTKSFTRWGLIATNWQLGLFPLILDNEYYSLALRTFRSQRDPSWIDRWQVLLNSTGRGTKVVDERAGYWRWAALVGFLPSPYENRVAVVLLVQPSGWGGSQAPLRFVVAGSSLKVGFPKP